MDYFTSDEHYSNLLYGSFKEPYENNAVLKISSKWDLIIVGAQEYSKQNLSGLTSTKKEAQHLYQCYF